MNQDCLWLKNTHIAHRGLHKEDKTIPENSIASFQKAIEHGYSIELDVNILKDNTLVVFHDENLKRMCGFDKNLNQLTKDDLDKYYLLDTNQQIPLLEDVLKMVNGKVPLLIELKSKNIKKMIPIFNSLINNYYGSWAVFSFSPYIVKWYYKNNPLVCYGLISGYHLEKKIPKFIKNYLSQLKVLKKYDCKFISYNIKDLPNKYLDYYYNLGKIVISYTANSKEELAYVKSHYDNCVFQYFKP